MGQPGDADASADTAEDPKKTVEELLKTADERLGRGSCWEEAHE